MTCPYTDNSVLLCPLSHAFCPAIHINLKAHASKKRAFAPPNPAPPPAVSRSSFTLHPARTHPSCTRTKSSINALTPSLLYVTQAFSSGINAPTSDTIPEGCSRGCSIRSGPETVRQSPCMAPGSLIILLHSRLLRHARTANGSYCAPSACQGAANWTWQPVKPSSLQAPPETSDCRPSWTSIRLVWTAQRRSIAILKATVSALSTPEPAPA